jgi:hypothetical protein
MVLGYDYSKQKRQWWRTNVPPSTVISIAMVVCLSNIDGIAQCNMFKATPEASTGCRHKATTRSVLPQRPPGQQQTKQRQKNVPKRLAILMAAVVRRYDTTRIAQ